MCGNADSSHRISHPAAKSTTLLLDIGILAIDWASDAPNTVMVVIVTSTSEVSFKSPYYTNLRGLAGVDPEFSGEDREPEFLGPFEAEV